jgi:hypothetical protein
LPGVKGGRARLIHIDKNVRHFIMKTPTMRQRHPGLAGRALPHYEADKQTSALLKINGVLQNMTPLEQERLAVLLAREGIQGFLQSLGITAIDAGKKTAGNLPFSFYVPSYCWLSRSAIKSSALLIRSMLRDLPIACTVTSSAGDCPAYGNAQRHTDFPHPTSSSSAVAWIAWCTFSAVQSSARRVYRAPLPAVDARPDADVFRRIGIKLSEIFIEVTAACRNFFQRFATLAQQFHQISQLRAIAGINIFLLNVPLQMVATYSGASVLI